MKIEIQEEEDQFKSKISPHASFNSLNTAQPQIMGGDQLEQERKEELLRLLGLIQSQSSQVSLGEILKTIQKALSASDIK